jgi:hypothetical protein
VRERDVFGAGLSRQHARLCAGELACAVERGRQVGEVLHAVLCEQLVLAA